MFIEYICITTYFQVVNCKFQILALKRHAHTVPPYPDASANKIELFCREARSEYIRPQKHANISILSVRNIVSCCRLPENRYYLFSLLWRYASHEGLVSIIKKTILFNQGGATVLESVLARTFCLPILCFLFRKLPTVKESASRYWKLG